LKHARPATDKPTMLAYAAVVAAYLFLGVEAGPVSIKDGKFAWTPYARLFRRDQV